MNARRSYLIVPLFLLTFLFPVPTWAGFDEGKEAYERGDFVTAVKEWRSLAEQGDPNAQGLLGVSYEKGKGVPQDYQQAAKWFRLAADQGHPLAQLNLGWLYARGTGVPQDFVQARQWYEKAAAVQRQLELLGVLPHNRMLPERGGKIMGKSVHAGSGKNEPPGLSCPPLLNTPLERSKLPA